MNHSLVRFHYIIKSALSALKFRAEHTSENYVYTLFAFLPLLLMARGLHGFEIKARTRPVHEIVWPDPAQVAQLNLEPEPDPNSPPPPLSPKLSFKQ